MGPRLPTAPFGGPSKELDFARKSTLPTAKLHAMVKFGGILLAVVVVVVAGLPGVEGRGTENSQIWGGDFFIMKLIKKVKDLKGFGASAAHGPF